MLIKSIYVKDFRKIKNFQKEINGQSIVLLGENAIGKSSLIRAIQICLGDQDAIGIDQVTHGEKESIIEVVTDGESGKYTFEAKFEAGNNKPKVTVTAPDGLKSSAKSVIGQLTSEISLDIDHFVELSRTEKGRKEQVEIVKSFLPIEVKEDLKKHENKIKTMYDDRTEINRQIKTMQGFIKEAGLSQSDMEKFFLKEDVSKLTEEMNQAIATNQNVSKALSKGEEIDRMVSANTIQIQKLRDQITDLENANQSLSVDKEKVDKWIVTNKQVDITELQEKIKVANDHNLMHQKVNDVRTQQMKMEALNTDSESLTIMIETTRQAVSDTIKDLDMPIDGLSFTEDMLTYNGFAVDESTMSTSEIMMLGVKLKMAKNPNAKVLFIERGESLGAQKLKGLQQMAKEHGFQIILEQVQRGQEELTIEIMPQY